MSGSRETYYIIDNLKEALESADFVDDSLYDSRGDKPKLETRDGDARLIWNGDINSGQELIISYDMIVKKDAKPGEFKNTAWALRDQSHVIDHEDQAPLLWKGPEGAEDSQAESTETVDVISAGGSGIGNGSGNGDNKSTSTSRGDNKTSTSTGGTGSGNDAKSASTSTVDLVL